MTEHQAVLTAVNWWSDKIREGLAEQQLEKFREKLMGLICSEISTDLAMGYDGTNVWITCHIYPCEILRDAAVQAGIPESNFPKFIDMLIQSVDGGVHYEVCVHDGFGPCYKKLIQMNESEE